MSTLVYDVMPKKKSKDGRGGPRPGSGRKPIGDEKMVPRNVLALPAQWDRWRVQADSQGVSLNEFIRSACDSACESDD